MIDDCLLETIENHLKDVFKDHPERFRHIQNVKKVAVALGEVYKARIPDVIAASYLHDITKNLSDEENIRLAGNLYSEDVPKACAHAYAACNLAREKFLIDDEDILNAIKYHCSGRKAMSLLEKIIFVSDFIEEGRDFVDEELRKKASDNLDATVLVIMKRTKEYLLKNNLPFSSLTEEAIQYYEKELEELND